MAETDVFPPSSKPATVTPRTGVRAKVKRRIPKIENILLRDVGGSNEGGETLKVLEGFFGHERYPVHL